MKKRNTNQRQKKQMPVQNYQLSIFNPEDEKLKAIRKLMETININTLTPVEALMKLNELKGVVKD